MRKATLAMRVATREAGRQTTATETAAQAALLNAQSVINSERPWLLIQRAGIQKPYLEPVESMPQRMSHCILLIQNLGRTPAKNYVEQSEMGIGDSPSAPPQSTLYQQALIVDDAPFVFAPGETVPAEAILAPQAVISTADKDAIGNGNKFLWLCGRIRYKDTFDGGRVSEHETRFCLRWETRLNSPEPFWVMAGPSEYNGAT